MPTNDDPRTESDLRANALASGIVAASDLKPGDPLDGEAMAVRLAHWIMTGVHPDVSQEG